MTPTAPSPDPAAPAPPFTRHTLCVALAGNPNTGKTTLFNALTGYHSRVGNYPGVTVDRKTGRLRCGRNETDVDLVDLPGTYSLSACSRDEAIAMDALVGGLPGQPIPDAVLCVVDAAHLHRNLFLVSQILDLGVPVVVGLNMVDLAEAAGLKIDAALLSSRLGVAVVPIVATRGDGLDDLACAVVSAASSRVAPPGTPLPEPLAQEVDRLATTLPPMGVASDRSRRAIALQALLHDDGVYAGRLVASRANGAASALSEARARFDRAGQPRAELEAGFRYPWIDGVLRDVVTRSPAGGRRRSDALDAVLTHPLVGLAVFAAIMAVVFQSIYSWSGPLMDGIGTGFGAIGEAVAPLLPEGALRSLVTNGIVAGVGGVLTFLPQILVLFLFIAILEDCGYMARAALLAHRFMSPFGLSGKSFIPLLSSFACAIPGVMATRVIDHPRDRLVTMLIAPLMSCSARLPVYVLLIGAFVPAVPLAGGLFGLQGLVLAAMYLVGVVVAIPVAMILQRTVLTGQAPPFLLELPSYKWPSPRTVLFRVYEQGREFVRQAGTIILAMTIVIWALGYYPRPASIAADFAARRQAAEAAPPEALAETLAAIDRDEAGAYLRQSYLGRMGTWFEPVVRPLGWDWRIGTAAIASFPAREVVIATMGTIYNLGDGEDETSPDLRATLLSARWPDGRLVFNLPVALSIMVFFALCCQCGGTLAAIKRETGSWRWPLFTFGYMTALAYLGALLTYQVASRLV